MSLVAWSSPKIQLRKYLSWLYQMFMHFDTIQKVRQTDRLTTVITHTAVAQTA